MERIYRLLCAALLGAQVFFAAAAAQVAFSGLIPRHDAGEVVGAMLARLDAATLVVCAIAAVLALRLGRRRSAALPLGAGLCATLSVAWLTPAIHAMRLAGTVTSPRFGMLHGVSSSLLLLEMILLAIAAWIG